jgi:valyl-tRNA synthetase
MNMEGEPLGQRPAEVADIPGEELADRWIISRYYRTVDAVTRGLDGYRLHDAIASIYDFFWHDYCDYYLELIKARVGRDSSPESREVPLQIAVGVMEGCMRLLHPFMPFISEEIWQALDGRRFESIMISPWPARRDDAIVPEAETDMKLLQECIDAIRNIRGEMSIAPRKKVDVVFKPKDERFAELLNNHRRYFENLAGTGEIVISADGEIPKPAARAFPSGAEIHVPLAGIIDIDKERERLEKARAKVESEIVSHDKKLSNEKFLSKAPADVVENTRKRQEELKRKREKLSESLMYLEE